jgi:hypothetical protein
MMYAGIMLDRKTFTRRLSALEKTQAHMALACGVLPTTVYAWGHRGNHPFPASVETILTAWEEIARLRAALALRKEAA